MNGGKERKVDDRLLIMSSEPVSQCICGDENMRRCWNVEVVIRNQR